MKDSWYTLEKPGYFGSQREKIHEQFDSQFGEGNWRLVWELGSIFLPKEEAHQVYEDAYFEFLKSDKKISSWLISTASDVYDDTKGNVNSGLNYNIQETKGNHLQDIAIRKSIRRLGVWFEGDHLVQVQGLNSQGHMLTPYKVPFHLAERISTKEIKYYSAKGRWWERFRIKNSLEEWYQTAKTIQVKNK